MPSPLMPALDETITAAIKARVEASIIDALSGHEQLVAGLVKAALNIKVKPTGNTYGTEITWLQNAAQDLVREATKAALVSQLEELKPMIEAELAKAIRGDTKTIAKAMVAGMLEHSGLPYRINVAFEHYADR